MLIIIQNTQISQILVKYQRSPNALQLSDVNLEEYDLIDLVMKKTALPLTPINTFSAFS